MLNALTIDLEDYFQVHAFSKVIKFEDWGNFECRIERNTDHLLEILSSAHSPQHSITHSPGHSLTQKAKATFFVLGWIAERYPGLIQRIQKEGHEIACHGYGHKLVYTQSMDEFRQDIKKAKAILEDLTGGEVSGYRAPSYSITRNSLWAFGILVEEGFKYDSSIFPIHHDFYGFPDAPRFPFVVSLNGNQNVEFSTLNVQLRTAEPQHSTTAARRNSITHSLINPSSGLSEPHHGTTAAPSNSITHSLINPSSSLSEPQHSSTGAPNNLFPHSLINSKSLIEFPISTVRVFGTNFPMSGGGYFRLFPYPVVKRGLKKINQVEGKPFLFYLHPWEIDPQQPRVNGISSRSKFRHYVNLDKTEFKFNKLLSDFRFSSIKELLRSNRNTY